MDTTVDQRQQQTRYVDPDMHLVEILRQLNNTTERIVEDLREINASLREMPHAYLSR